MRLFLFIFVFTMLTLTSHAIEPRHTPESPSDLRPQMALPDPLGLINDVDFDVWNNRRGRFEFVDFNQLGNLRIIRVAPSSEERIQELEREVAELKARLRALEAHVFSDTKPDTNDDEKPNSFHRRSTDPALEIPVPPQPVKEESDKPKLSGEKQF